MINLLQENIEMKSQRINSTFGFCRHTGKPEKTKKPVPSFLREAIFCQCSLLTMRIEI